MPEIQWIKISTGLFDDEKIKLIAKLPDADTIIMIWIYLLILAGKVNDGGLIYLGDHIAYNPEELATVIDRPVNTIRLALATFRKFKMVEELPDALLITNWEKHQNVEGMDKVRSDTRLRVQNFRERKLLLANTCNKESEAVTLPNVTVTGQNRTEQNRQEVEQNRTEQKELLLNTGEVFENVFLLYETNIEPINDNLKELIAAACQKYTDIWVIDAILEIKGKNNIKHKWEYLRSILENWTEKGHTVKRNVTDSQANKFTSGKYGHMVQTGLEEDETKDE
jgi:predicted phage replisome organizer